MSEQVGSVSFAARLLFAGLWTIADRDGRLRWQPKRIKAQIFPYDDGLELHALAEELVDAKPTDGEGERLIAFYQDDKGVYAYLPGFVKHQRPHPKEAASTVPEYPSTQDPGWLPWNKTASPETIPSSRGGREGKGTDPDPDQEGKGAGTVRATAPRGGLVESPLDWHRKHGSHLTGFCDWLCFPLDLAEQFASRAGWPDVTAVAGWAKAVRGNWQANQRIPAGKMYDFWNDRWTETHGVPKPVVPVAKALPPDYGESYAQARQREREAAEGGFRP